MILEGLIAGHTLTPCPDVEVWPAGPMVAHRCLANSMDIAEQHGWRIVVGTITYVQMMPNADASAKVTTTVTERHAWVVDNDGQHYEVTLDAATVARLDPKYNGHIVAGGSAR